MPAQDADAGPRPARARPARRRHAAYRGYRGAEALTRLLPHRLNYAAGALLGDLALLSRPRRFDALRGNLRRVLPQASDRELRRVVRANVRNLARCWVDVMEMPHRAAALSARVHPINVENMTGPLARGRGVVIVSLHLGSWEVGLAGWNHRFGRMALLAESLQPPELFARIVAARGNLGVTVIPIDTAAMRSADDLTARRLGAAALRQVMRTLRGNGMVAMAIDRDLIGTGELLPFFGAPAPIPVGVVEVAIRSGAAIVPVVLLRAGDAVVAPCFPEIAYDAKAPRDAEVRRVTTEVLRTLEPVIREHPEQWHVLEPIWRSDARAEVAGAA